MLYEVITKIKSVPLSIPADTANGTYEVPAAGPVTAIDRWLAARVISYNFV